MNSHRAFWYAASPMGVRVGSQAASPPSSTSLHAVSAGRLRRAFRAPDIASLLVSLSRDVFNLTYLGMAERLRELLAEDPQLANAVAPRAGITPLFCLPDDEVSAVTMTKLLLTHGADRSIINKEGLTAEQDARRRGLVDAADLMSGKTA